MWFAGVIVGGVKCEDPVAVSNGTFCPLSFSLHQRGVAK